MRCSIAIYVDKIFSRGGVRIAREAMKRRVFVLSPYPETHACAYVRVAAPMRAAGWDVVWSKGLDFVQSVLEARPWVDADLVVIQRQSPSSRTEGLMKALFRARIPVVYDLDDMLLDVPEQHPSFAGLRSRGPFIRWGLQQADLVTASTEFLADELRRKTRQPVRVQPNLVDTALFRRAGVPSTDGGFRFLVSGTSTHVRDWALVERPLKRILDSHAGSVEAVFFGAVPRGLTGHPGVHCVPFEGDYRAYASRLAGLQVDAALVPLEDSTFNRCKSNIKWLEYSCLGIPGVYSKVGPYVESIEHLRTGLLTENSEDSWFDAMMCLLSRRREAARMAERARRQVLDCFSLERKAKEYVATFEELVSRGRRWRPLAGMSTASGRALVRVREALAQSAFIDRHIRWRLKR